MSISIVMHFQRYFPKSENWPKICGFRDYKGKILRINVETPLGNQSPPKHVIQCKKYGNTPNNVLSRAWQKSIKKKEKHF